MAKVPTAVAGRVGRLRRLSTHTAEGCLTAVVFVVLRRMGLLGSLPILTLLGLLLCAALATRLVESRWGPGPTRGGLHVRLSVKMLTTTAVIYATGWGPALAMGYVVVASEDVRVCGSGAWRPATTWAVVGMVLGQAAIGAGVFPSYVGVPYVHGLAALAVLALVFVVRALGVKTAALEAEAEQRSRAEEAARRSEERFRSLVQNSSDVVTVVDASGQITYVSPSIERIMGHRPEDLLQSSGFALIHADDLEHSHEILARVVASAGEEHTMEVRARHADGTWRWHEVTVRNLLGDPAVAGIVANHRDITERRAYQQRLAHEARHDPLTGLANRKAFLERLEHALARSRRHQSGVAVLFVDLDRFKLINDSLGHNLGDRLLAVVAKRLESCVRPEDTVARLSGDEFTVLLEDVADPAIATRTAERLADHLRVPIEIGTREIVVTASVGVATSARGAESPEDLLCRADLAMYAAKEGGRARAAVFDADETPQFVDRVELEAGLRSALDRGELDLHYQPIVDLATGRVTGCEALLRWDHPARGTLAPIAFIGLAEETGLIIPIGRWVVEEACRTLAAWRRARPDRGHLTMSVNVSAVQLHHPGFADDVAQALVRSGVPAESLVVEVTESVLVRAEATAGVLQRLHDLGVRVALDDFGTGYSSLAYLRRLPLDFVKIDRTFVADLEGAGADPAIVRAITELARTLGLGTVAEGVETEAQARALAGLGCGLAQGHLFCRPASAGVLEGLLDAGLPGDRGLPAEMAGRQQ